MEFDNNRPIFQQIVEYFQLQIASGQLLPGSKIGSVRELSIEMSVNPNTMQKALSVLEQHELMFTERTSGRYVTNNEKIIFELKQSLLRQHTKHFFESVKSLGYLENEIIRIVEQYQIKEEGE